LTIHQIFVFRGQPNYVLMDLEAAGGPGNVFIPSVGDWVSGDIKGSQPFAGRVGRRDIRYEGERGTFVEGSLKMIVFLFLEHI
jgi:hypothetical protein